MGKKKPADQHKSKFMVRLPDEWKVVLEEITSRTMRAFTVEVQIALAKHAEAMGVKSPAVSGKWK